MAISQSILKMWTSGLPKVQCLLKIDEQMKKRTTMQTILFHHQHHNLLLKSDLWRALNTQLWIMFTILMTVSYNVPVETLTRWRLYITIIYKPQETAIQTANQGSFLICANCIFSRFTDFSSVIFALACYCFNMAVLNMLPESQKVRAHHLHHDPTGLWSGSQN